jgi:hypothetical protein
MEIDVVTGHDGYLFLRQGSNEVLRFYTEPDYFPDALATAWAERLIERWDYFVGEGIRYVHLGVPDKITMLADKYPAPLPYLHRHPLALVDAALHTLGEPHILVNPMKVLAGARHPIYARTDTHWTIWAAGIAYAQVCRRLGFDPVVNLATREPIRIRGIFDLGGKLTPPIEEDAVHFPMPPHIERTYANEIVTLVEQAEARGQPAPMHLGSHIIYRNPKAPYRETIFIFGDSYVDYRPSSFTAFMAETFAETHFFWSGHIDRTLVKTSGAKLVVSEFNERFMGWCPDDIFDGPAYAAARAAEYLAGLGAGKG